MHKTSRRALLAGTPAVAAAAPAGGTITTALAMSGPKADGLDWPSIILRAEETIDKLRKYYGSSWDAADQESANWLLKYCRDQAADLPEDEATWQLTVDFFEQYNQSLDWVFSGDPVTMIAAGASRSPRGVPAWALESDPIFGLIEKHVAACDAARETSDASRDMHPHDPQYDATEEVVRRVHQARKVALVEVHSWQAASRISADLEETDDPGYEAAERLTSKKSDREMKALRALLRCQPTTLAGVIALLDHLGQPQLLHEKSDGTVLSGTDCWWDQDKNELRAFPHMLADALRSLVGSSISAA
jgi:hypothetical protein